MIGYAIIMLLVSAAFALVAVLVYKGNTKLIHDYHQARVTDRAGYGKAFGKATGIFAVSMALSGLISLLGEAAIWVAVGVLFLGLIIGILVILRIQKKYNGGVFS